ncbi:hypothetical protein KOI35_31835 [Actinoplanes bogorensis]|uniref:Uncharacterized protein n=1 Tax=Paractinoplanes bogorensis TaxID=1610840 RepID=A0ABS5YXF6_9ACTN|nr:hypothetical protein [Actinoplanes bogorensis]MBU2668111.1 hypothetical protein [Actinoplanes bogorensis]
MYARIQELSRTYRLRRRIVQSAGGALLGAGALAGVVQMHGFLQGGTAVVAPSPAVASRVVEVPTRLPSPSETLPSETPPPGQAEMDAFFAAGYSWPDAERLARLWHYRDPTDAKVEAGRRLLAGKRLPR